MATDIKALVRRAVDEIWNNKNMQAIDELISPDCVFNDPLSPTPVRGIAAHKQLVQSRTSAFPDLHFTIDDQIAEGQSVVNRWTATGTHRGELFGIPATGRHLTVRGISINRLENGKFVEVWSSWDTLGLMQQLGVAPVKAVEQAA